jgi:hypothetical protein
MRGKPTHMQMYKGHITFVHSDPSIGWVVIVYNDVYVPIDCPRAARRRDLRLPREKAGYHYSVFVTPRGLDPWWHSPETCTAYIGEIYIRPFQRKKRYNEETGEEENVGTGVTRKKFVRAISALVVADGFQWPTL